MAQTKNPALVARNNRRHLCVRAQARYSNGLAILVDSERVSDCVTLQRAEFADLSIGLPDHCFKPKDLKRSSG